MDGRKLGSPTSRAQGQYGDNRMFSHEHAARRERDEVCSVHDGLRNTYFYSVTD